MFKPVSPKVEFPKLEESINQYWKENKIFEKSITSRPKDKRWTFLDGPPFVTGMPHYGSLLSSLPKDVFGRYWTMKGYRVRRVWGWDGHGLPIENKVENELEIARKKDIEEIVGVKKFIDACKSYVNIVSSDWEWYVDRIGRWVDFKNAYKTWDTNYMESVMWVFKQMYDKGYIYKGYKVNLYCPHCSTPISNFEVAMDAENYKDMKDPATTYKFPLVGEKDTYILAWSTTPWNKIVTTTLAVNPELTYVKVKQGSEYYILAETTVKILTDEPGYEIVEHIKGKDLIGKKYVPHYDYFKDRLTGKAFEIAGADFVTATEGTGVVTIAAYGEEDLKLMKEQGFHIETHLDEEGTVKADVPLFGGMYYLKANKAVDADLEERGLVYKVVEYTHSVPLCWRCHTRLYYSPINAWYVNVQDLKPLLLETNEKVNWFPKHFKKGRFQKSVENAPDWNISRNRYWGSPVPVWECECGERFVPGSIAELEEASGRKVVELHRPEIDDVVVTCKKCGKEAHRVPEVLDSWIEAGSASFAERHYPFDSSEKIEDFFPPDYISEYTGQIRSWFYVLHVIGAALYKQQAFKNVSVTGVILGTDGRKMSKNFKNYPDPAEMLHKYGGDALRLYLLGTPVMRGEDILISEDQYKMQVRGTMLILWNTFNFFVTYANLDGWEPNNKSFDAAQVRENVLDEWILSLLVQAKSDITKSLDAYDTVGAIDAIKDFVTDFSTWYIRRSRDRVGPSAEDEKDKNAFYETTYHVLTTVTKLTAPIIPFVSEEIYRNLTEEESVHLADWPKTKESKINNDLLWQMKHVREVVEQVLSIRKDHQLKVKQPLGRLGFFGEEAKEIELWGRFEELLKAELNIKKIEYINYKDVPKGEHIIDATTSDRWNKERRFFVDIQVTPELQAEGQAREIVRKIQEERKKLETKLDEKVDVVLETWPEKFEDYIKKNALVNSLSKGEFAVIKPE